MASGQTTYRDWLNALEVVSAKAHLYPGPLCGAVTENSTTDVKPDEPRTPARLVACSPSRWLARLYGRIMPRRGLHASIWQQIDSRDAHPVFRRWREVPEWIPLHSMVAGFVCHQMFWPIGTSLLEDPLEVVLFDPTWRGRRFRKVAKAVARCTGTDDTLFPMRSSLTRATYGDWLVHLRAAVGAR